VKTVHARLRGIASYSQSKHYDEPKMQGESDKDHYKRTWRGHLHTDSNDLVIMPATQLKNSLAAAAKFINMKIPGQGNATYTKHFEAGILCLKSNHLLVPNVDPADSSKCLDKEKDRNDWVSIHKDKVACENLFLSPTGDRGGKKRVDKFYPIFPIWAVDAEYSVIDETCLQTCLNPKDPNDKEYTVFRKVLAATGSFIGLGRFRPRNNGFYGRFLVDDFKIVDDGDTSTFTILEDDDDEDETPRKRTRLSAA
jgi:hypothetical protein